MKPSRFFGANQLRERRGGAMTGSVYNRRAPPSRGGARGRVVSAALGYRARLHAAAPRPARPKPSKIKLAGAGTAVVQCASKVRMPSPPVNSTDTAKLSPESSEVPAGAKNSTVLPLITRVQSTLSEKFVKKVEPESDTVLK